MSINLVKSRILNAALTTAMAATILTDVSDPIHSTFLVDSRPSVDIVVQTENFESNAVISPGGSICYDPYIINKSNHDVYVFLSVTVPDESYHLVEMSEDWTPLFTKGNRTIYYYGSDGCLSSLSRRSKNNNFPFTPMLCSGLSLDQQATIGQSKDEVIAQGYAIQCDTVDTKNPKSVWKILEKNI